MNDKLGNGLTVDEYLEAGPVGFDEERCINYEETEQAQKCKSYLVMAGIFWDDHAHPHSVHKGRLAAESVAACIEEDKDEDGYANSYAYVTEIDFYDQDA